MPRRTKKAPERKTPGTKPFLVPDEEVALVLKKTRGLLTYAAKRLGYTLSGLKARIDATPPLLQALADAREEIVDVAENRLYRKVRSGSEWAIDIVLNTHGKSRGYGAKTVHHKHGGDEDAPPIRVEGVVPVADLNLTLDEKLWLLEKLRAAQDKVIDAPPPPQTPKEIPHRAPTT